MSLHEALALFPLELVLYPDEKLPLHIFELRYQEMIDDCVDAERPFGVVLSRDEKLSDVGCIASIEKIVQVYEDGRKDIVVRGGSRFRILGVADRKSYLTADILTITDDERSVGVTVRERVIAQHIKLLELAGRMPEPLHYQDREFLSYFIAHNSGLTNEQKQEILELTSENARLSFLVKHLGRFIPMVEEAETLRKKIRSNGHFKDFPPVNGEND